jgi:hypothetical protein
MTEKILATTPPSPASSSAQAVAVGKSPAARKKPAPKTATKPVTKAAIQAPAEPVRSVARGDTSGANSTAGIARRVINKSIDAAQISKNQAISDILANATSKVDALKTLLEGSSPDDAAAIRQMLLEGQAQ